MKKVVFVFFITVIVSIVYSIYYFNQYSIENNESAIQANLKEWMNRGSNVNPNVIEVVQLDDTNSYVVLFRTESSNIGYAHLIKGLNGKFKIDHSAHGTNIVKYTIIKTTSKNTYGLLYGKNPGLKIDHIKTKLSNGEYQFTFQVNGVENFLRYIQVPNDIEKPIVADFTYYDKNSAVIELRNLN